MFTQFEDMVVNTLVKKMDEHGFKMDPEMVKRAISNSPQIVAQIEEILLASSSEDRLAKIKALLTQAAGNGAATSTQKVNQEAVSMERDTKV